MNRSLGTIIVSFLGGCLLAAFFVCDIDEAKFQSRLLEESNASRQRQGLDDLVSDPEIRRSLRGFLMTQGNLAARDMPDALQNHIQTAIPDVQVSSAIQFQSLRLAELPQRLGAWNDVTRPECKSLTAVVVRHGVIYRGIAMLATRLPPLDVHSPFPGSADFYEICPLCDKAYTASFSGNETGLVLECPHCGRSYDFLVVDSVGRLRQVGSLLEADQPLPIAVFEGSQIDVLRKVWQCVLERCEYQYDTSGFNRDDVWKTPTETWQDRSGDCEDTSTLLTHALSKNNLEARIVVGAVNWHENSHAWCVARIGHHQFILESTMQEDASGKTLPEPIPVAEAANNYIPAYMFDGHRVYCRKNKSHDLQRCYDYWSDEFWTAVIPPFRP
jgi:predicted transglutaminase-like cysteine proteinase